MMEALFYLNLILFLANGYFLVRGLLKKSPKLEFFKEGIRISNHKDEIVVEYDKPLKK